MVFFCDRRFDICEIGAEQMCNADLFFFFLMLVSEQSNGN